MISEDVKLMSHQQFPDSELGFKEFKYWEVFLVVQTYAKFRAGVEASWPKRTKTNASGRDPDPSIVFPPPSPDWVKGRDADG